jgi:hypothetical protein
VRIVFGHASVKSAPHRLFRICASSHPTAVPDQGEAIMREQFTKTNIAGQRYKLPAEARSVTLNVRVTPKQYRMWRRAADYVGYSLSAWVEFSLDGLAGGHPLILDVLRQYAPRFKGRIPIYHLREVLERRWRWSDLETNWALAELADDGLVSLYAEAPGSLEARIEGEDGLRTKTGWIVTSVGLAIGTRPRPGSSMKRSFARRRSATRRSDGM